MLSLQSPLDVALPAVKKLPECADYFHTVEPFLPQLYDLPQKLLENYNDVEALKNIYLSTNPLMTGLAFALFLTPIVLIVSEVNKNYSQVDRLWSILPVIYNCHYAIWARLVGVQSQRLDHIMAVTVLWGARLSFNYWRKGGYSVGSQDYRWPIVKEWCGPVLMFIFNVVFISLAQNILLWIITAPTYILLLCSRITGDSFSSYDNIFPKVIFLCVVIEFYADQQQWNYHQAKKTYQQTAKTPKEYSFTREQLDRGFNTTGLFAWSRHPNFAAEQAVWVLLYQWSSSESRTYTNWTFAGVISYLFLFQASTWLTELVSAKKYPEYNVYRERVGKFLPKGNTQDMDAPLSEENETMPNGGNSKGAGKTKKR